MKKRILSCLMALALCLTLLPTAALAAEGEGSTQSHIHYLCGGSNSCTCPEGHKEGTDPVEFKAWEDDTRLPTTAGYYYLTKNVTRSSVWEPGEGVVLCLNGHSIKTTEDFSDGHTIGVENTLTICNCQNKGSISNESKASNRCVVSVKGGGTFKLYGGTITGGYTAQSGGGVYVTGNSENKKGAFELYGGTITGNTAVFGGGVSVDSNGAFTMYGGTISGNFAGGSYEQGGGVYVNSGTFNMSGGEITANCTTTNYEGEGGGVYVNSGTFNMTGGAITGGSAEKNIFRYGGGVYLNGGTFNMSGTARITGNTVNGNHKNVESEGGGVYVKNGAFNMSGRAEITNNQAIGSTGKTFDGGGVAVNGGTFTMSENAKITGNTAGSYGGGVYVWKGTFNMNGGELSGNKVQGSSSSGNILGGGVYVGGSTTFNMTGGSITQNTLADSYYSYGGGVYVGGSTTFNMTGGSITQNTATNSGYGSGVYVNPDGTFTVSGTPTVKENKNSRGNVYLASRTGSGVTTTAVVTVSGPLNEGASIGVTSSVNYKNFPVTVAKGAAATAGGTGYSVTENDAKAFFADSGSCHIELENAEVKLCQGALHVHYLCGGKEKCSAPEGVQHPNCVSTTFKEIKTEAELKTAAQNGGTYYLSGNISLSEKLEVTKDLTLCLNGNSINVTQSRDAIEVANGVTFTLCDCKGGTDKYGKITHTSQYSTGRGVVVKGGTFNLYGGSITVNKMSSSTDKGGGVCVESGTFNMYGGELTKNETGYGGGVFVGGTFNLYSGLIEGNKSKCNLDDGGGGGVQVGDGGTFNMTGGTITNNTANYGAGVYAGGTFNMSSRALITNNTANFNGGGVYVGVGSTGGFNMTGGFISTNTARLGGGVYVGKYSDSRFVMSGGSITGNKAKFGGGVFVTADKMTVSGKVLIRNNENTEENSPAQNVYLSSGKTIAIGTNGLDADAKIYVTTESTPREGNPVAIVKDVTEDYSGNFISDNNTDYEVKHDATGKKLTLAVKGDTGGETHPPVLVTQITLNKTETSITVGKSEQLTATIQPSSATNQNVTWESSAPQIATVENGKVTAKAVGSATITVKAEGGSNASATCAVTVTANAPVEPEKPKPEPKPEPSQPGGSTGGSSSGSSGGSSSGSYDSNPIIKTETKNNADGSTTKTETRKDGSVTATTTGKDGSVSKTETKKDGSSVTENKAADGSTGTVKTDKNGQTEAKTALSNKAIENAKKNGEPVKAPVEVEASRNSGTAPTVKVELPQNSGKTEVEIPVSNANAGTVAVLVHADGTEEILRASVPTENGIRLTVDGSATVKIVDNAKGFIDTQNHWAKDEIDFVSARELVNGISATRYAPDATATRAQLWTILARKNDADLSGGANWYEKAQLWSKDKGISDGTQPDATITRAQMVTMLWRTMGQPAATDKVSFADVPAGSYYAQAVAWAVESGITQGVGGDRFAPNATCTRAQIAAFLARSMK